MIVASAPQPLCLPPVLLGTNICSIYTCSCCVHSSTGKHAYRKHWLSSACTYTCENNVLNNGYQLNNEGSVYPYVHS